MTGADEIACIPTEIPPFCSYFMNQRGRLERIVKFVKYRGLLSLKSDLELPIIMAVKKVKGFIGGVPLH